MSLYTFGKNDMKKITKIKTIIIAIGIIFTFLIFININFNYYQGKNYGILESNNNHILKKAGFWEIGPIEIDDDDPTKNWLITEATYDWCSGSGTINNPYIIENITIDGSYTDSCILIKNSLESYFIIRNCTVFHSGGNEEDAAIKLQYTKKGTLQENNCSNNYNGINIIGSDNNTISNNNINMNSYRGLNLDSCENNTISFNNCSDNNYGIKIVFSHNNTISDNICLKNDCGFRMDVSHNNTISFNNCSDNDYGIQIRFSDENIISDNNCSNNYNGIYMDGSIENIISDNKITYNSGSTSSRGISITSTSNVNLFFKNIFINNYIHAIDDGYGNQWDNGSIGNYWDDYTGTDADGDGIGDTPYDVPPPGGSVDNYPIWEDEDELGPEIIINIPDMNDVFGINAPYFDITINDESPINTTWYKIDDGTTNYTFTGLTGTVNQTAWDNKETEIITLRFYANDSLGYIGFKDILIWKDLVAPKITINSPTPNQLCGIAAPSFNLQIIEPNLQEKKYSLNGRPNITFTTETQFSQTEWNQVGNGTVSITFYAIDKVGNTNSSEVIVRKDAYVPDVTIYSPLDNQKFGKTAPDYNISIIEEDLVST